MKKIIGIVFLIVLISNMFHLQHKSDNLDSNLMVIMKQANAQGEVTDEEEVVDGGMLEEVTCYGSSTYEEGGNGSATISWTTYWFDDPVNPTDEEISDMEDDLDMNRREGTITVYSGQNTFNGSVTGGWNFLFEGTVTGEAGYIAPSTSVDRTCCLDDFWDHCTHLPPCEAYDS